jgi:hypothetical protein
MNMRLGLGLAAVLSAGLGVASCGPQVPATPTLSQAQVAQTAAAYATAERPDLVITEFTITPETPRMGQPAHVRIETLNRGTAASGPYKVAWYGLMGYPTPSCIWDVANSDPGAKNVHECDFAFGSYYPKDRTSYAKVDADTQSTESDEENNEAVIWPFGVLPP